MYYAQKDAPATLEQLQGELKALREEVMWLRQLVRITYYEPRTAPAPPVFNPPTYYSNTGGYLG